MDIKLHCLIAFFLRIILIGFSSWQDSYFNVKYTDIDYQVFTDAARYVWNGESPFKRLTYRYTPLLAVLLVPNIFMHASFGKFLFCSLDIATSLLIYHIQKSCNYSDKICKLCTFLWLYNPLVIAISTRGSSESIMTSLIMLTIYLYQMKHSMLCGITYGLAIHTKIYPCIYALTLYFILCEYPVSKLNMWNKFKMLFFPNKRRVYFVLSTVAGFIIPTVISVYFCGNVYIKEGFLYHLIRKDVKHNFSPYFYALYLSETMNTSVLTYISHVALFIQATLIFFVSWVFYLPKFLTPCLFVQTFIFVTFNKVCTSQYFLWYLCLFPLSFPLLNVHMKYLFYAFIIWFFGQALWLIPAYYLEFKGINTFLLIFGSSLIFFVINVGLIAIFLVCISKSLNAKKDFKLQ